MSSSKRKLDFLESLGHTFEEIGRFKNEYGEMFIIFKLKDTKNNRYSRHYFITGDEFNWDIYHRLDLDLGVACHDFFFNDIELKEVTKIINENN